MRRRRFVVWKRRVVRAARRERNSRMVDILVVGLWFARELETIFVGKVKVGKRRVGEEREE